MANLREKNGTKYIKQWVDWVLSCEICTTVVVNNKDNITSLVDKPVGGRNQDLQCPLCPQDDADGEAKQMFVSVIQPHAYHIVLSPRRNQQLFACGEILQQDS